MHTLSSASRTCIASASAVECTATVAMPSSLQARRTRSAISPRLAIRILSNIAPRTPLHLSPLAGRGRLSSEARRSGEGGFMWCASPSPGSQLRCSPPSPRFAGRGKEETSLDDHQRLAVLHRLAVLEQDLRHLAGMRGGNLVHRLHRLDDQQWVTGLHHAADIDERLGDRKS